MLECDLDGFKVRYLWSDRWNSLIAFFFSFYVPVTLDSSHHPAVVLLTSRWRGFYHVNHTFHQLVKSNNLGRLNEPAVVWFLVGLAKRNAAWHAAWAGIAFCFITDTARKKGKKNKCVHIQPVLHEREREIWAWLPVPTELIISPIEPLAQFSRNRSPVH